MIGRRDPREILGMRRHSNYKLLAIVIACSGLQVCLAQELEVVPPAPLVVPGEVIVELKEVGAANGAAKLPTNLTRVAAGVFTFRSTGFADGAKAVAYSKEAADRDCNYAKSRLAKSGVVAKIDICEPNFVQKATKDSNDTYRSYLTSAFTGVNGANITSAWDISTGKRDVIVAVIDTGVDYKHPDLVNNMYRNPKEIPDNGIDDDGNGFVDDVFGYDFHDNDGDPMDENGHGTHCAGTIGAEGDNLTGVVGVNWQVQIMAVRFLGADGSGSTTDAIKAIDYAVANGAKVLSNSWGALLAKSSALQKAIQRAEAKGVVFVAAAGNDGINGDKYPTYPAAYDVSNIISVAATDPIDGTLAPFSNFGAKSVDIAAPGVNILSTYRGGGYAFMSGTSMATPHVAGAIGLLLSVKPELDHAAIIQLLTAHATFNKNLVGKVSSAGMLNVYGALSELAPLPTPTPPSGGGAQSGGGGGSASDDESSDVPSDPSFEYTLLFGRANAKGQILKGVATRKVGIELLGYSEDPNANDRFSLNLSDGVHSCSILTNQQISSNQSKSWEANIPSYKFKNTLHLKLKSEGGGEALSSLRVNLCRSGSQCSSTPSESVFNRLCNVIRSRIADASRRVRSKN